MTIFRTGTGLTRRDVRRLEWGRYEILAIETRRMWAASGALVVGLLVSPFLAGLLPFGGDSAVAAVIRRADRWNTGIALMQAGSRDG